MQAAPGAAFEVIEAELVLHLLVHLLADPAALDRRSQGLERCVGRKVGEVVLPLTCGAMLADEPSLISG